MKSFKYPLLILLLVSSAYAQDPSEAPPTSAQNFTVKKKFSLAAPGSALNISSNTITVTKSLHRLGNGGDTTLTTINGGTDGMVLTLIGHSSTSITVSTAGNIEWETGGTLVIGPDQAVTLAYDGTNSKWITISPVNAQCQQPQHRNYSRCKVPCYATNF